MLRFLFCLLFFTLGLATISKATGVAPEIAVEMPLGTDLANGSTVDLGNVAMRSGAYFTFTIKNTGNSNLSQVRARVEGLHTTDLVVHISPSGGVQPGGSTTLMIQIIPRGLGARSVDLRIESNDADEDPFMLYLIANGVEAEIEVKAADGADIADGSLRSFGTIYEGTNTSQTFTIKNTGIGELNILAVDKTGVYANNYEVTQAPASTVPPGGETTFTVRFTPTQLAPHPAQLRIYSTDGDENPFDIYVDGSAGRSDISVQLTSGLGFNDGDSCYFGIVVVGNSSVGDFSLRNLGTLALTGVTITVDGAHAGDFSVTTAPVPTVTPGATTPFIVQFSPKAPGARTANLHIASNDPDENPFDLVLTGGAQASEIEIKAPDNSILVDGGSRNFGALDVGASVNQTFTINNKGNASLTAVSISENGPDNSDFELVTPPAATVTPGTSTTFTVRFTPTAAGARTMLLQVSSNDSDENPFDITLNGTGRAPEIVVEQPGGNSLEDGGTQDFGSLPYGGNTSLTFTIRNTGAAALTGLFVSRGGQYPNDFEVMTSPAASVAAGGSTTLTVRFLPFGIGLRTATLQISSNDTDENPFNLTLTGTSIVPEIKVEDATGTDLPNGMSIDFGTQRVGSPTTERVVKVRNIGTDVLNCAFSKTGLHPDDFIMTLPAGNVAIAAGGSLDLPVSFQPSVVSQRQASLRITSNDSDEGIYEIPLTGTGVQAQIVVEASGTPLTSGAEHDFGRWPIPGDLARGFTIRNTGPSTMTNLAARIEGSPAGDFTIATAPSDTVLSGGSTFVAVRFSPKAIGARQATLVLTSDTAVGTPFSIVLKGLGGFSAVSFESPVFRALHGDTHAVLRVVRSEPSDYEATVRINTSDGPGMKVPPFEASLAGRDYLPLSGTTSDVTFAPGEITKEVTLPLLTLAAVAGKNRQLRVILSPINIVGTTVGAQSLAHVQILGKDSTKPTLTLTNPAAGKLSGLLPTLLKGTAGDAMGIDRVEMKLNDGEPVDVPLWISSTTTPTAVPFISSLSPVDGLNILVVTAYDLRGNSTSVRREFTFTHRQRLNITMRDPAFSSPSPSLGTVEMAAVPTTAATAPTVINGTPGKISTVVPGTLVKLVAKPAKGYVFNRWTSASEPGPVLTRLGDTVTFIMPDAFTAVEAEVMPAPFAPLTGETPNVHWLMSPPAPLEGEPVFAYQGYLSGALTTTGGFTGKLLMNGQTLPATATLYGDGPAIFTVAGQKRDSLPVPGGVLKIYPDLTATVTSAEGAVLLTSQGLRALAKAPAALLGTAAKVSYTLRLAPVPPAPVPMEPALYPQGFGYATMTLSNTGGLSLAGALADGTAVTMSSALLSGQVAPVFVQLPTPGGATKLTLLTGLLNFATSGVTGELRWYRPATSSPKVLLYPAGWPGGIRLAALGLPYAPTLTVQSALGLNPAVTGQANAQLYFWNGKLTTPVVKTNFSVNKNAVVKVAPADASYTLTLTPASGLFSGTFTPNWAQPAATKPTFKGVILPGLGGFGFFLNNAKNETAPESGAVTLGVPVP